MLLDNAAQDLGVPVDGADHRAERGGAREIRPASELWRDRRVRRGSGARRRRSSPSSSRKPKDFRLIGKDVMRVELPEKVNGTRPLQRSTCRCPDMLYGAVLRAPVEGSVPDKIDDAKAKAIAGVVRVVRLPYGVGVLAETPWAAFEARQRAHAVRDLDPHRHGLGLRQRQRHRRASRPTRKNPARHGDRVEQDRRRRAAQCRRPPRPWRPSIAATTPITRRWSR